jgi:peptidyl-prolyl cis-trans isomerase C
MAKPCLSPFIPKVMLPMGSIRKEQQMKRILLYGVVIFAIIGLSGFVRSELFSASEKILARVGEKVITQSDLDELMKRYEPFMKGAPFNSQEKKDLLNVLIKSTLIVTEAEKEKMDEKPEVQLKLKMYKNEILAKEYIASKIEPFVKVSDQEVEEVLKKNPNLIPKEMVTIREILVKTEKEADEIFQGLLKGADFSKMAAERSTAQSKSKGGLVGPFTKGHLSPSLEAIVFNLKEGEFSKPIKTEEGFQIVYLLSKKEEAPEKIKALEEKVRVKVLQLEKNKKIEAILERKVEELKKGIKVETYFDQIQ